MKSLVVRTLSIYLLCAAAVTGCSRRGAEFLGSWVNTQDPSDRFQITRNGEGYLIVGRDQKRGVGAIYKDGALEVKGAFLSTNLTYVKHSDSILAPGFFGQVEYKRQK